MERWHAVIPQRWPKTYPWGHWVPLYWPPKHNFARNKAEIFRNVWVSCHKWLWTNSKSLSSALCCYCSYYYFKCKYRYARPWSYFSYSPSINRGWNTNGNMNTLRPRRIGCHFAHDILKCIFLNGNVWIPIKMSLKFVPKGPINNILALVQITAWCRTGDKPLSEPMIVSVLTHIYVTRPQWVNYLLDFFYCIV